MKDRMFEEYKSVHNNQDGTTAFATVRKYWTEDCRLKTVTSVEGRGDLVFIDGKPEK